MKKGLKISFFGSSLLSSYWNGAATYYRGIIKELHRRGHCVTFFEPDAYNRQQNRDTESFDYASSIVYSADIDGVTKALQMAKDSDIIVKTSGVGVFDEFLESEVLQFQNADTAVIYWDVDAPATLERIKNNEQDYFRKLISDYDLIFTYGGGDRVVESYKDFGARNCVPVYNALDPQTHFPEKTDGRFEGTLGFLGNRLPDREARVQEFFFKTAKLLPQKLFILGGNGWDCPKELFPNVRHVGHVYTYEHNSFNSSTIAVLNINRQSMASYGFSPPTRIFEAAGACACIITDKWDGIEMFLEPQRECLVANCGEEVADILKKLTTNEAKKIGNAARKRIIAEHTYAQRASDVEQQLLSCKSGQEVIR